MLYLCRVKHLKNSALKIGLAARKDGIRDKPTKRSNPAWLGSKADRHAPFLKENYLMLKLILWKHFLKSQKEGSKMGGIARTNRSELRCRSSKTRY